MKEKAFDKVLDFVISELRELKGQYNNPNNTMRRIGKIEGKVKAYTAIIDLIDKEVNNK